MPEPIGRIRRLSTTLANQIAAGEVVERPASVLKELLENSLDAGATEISVDVEQGGVRLIRVRDDGRGIHHDDLALALSRHATSKILTLDDLEQVMSLGFRGEALPSIASVSRLVLASRCCGDEGGWQVRAEGVAAEADPEPLPHPPGTTVEVRDLFFNTPARRKFLRSEKTELGHLQEVVKRIALARFDVGLRLRNEHRGILSLRPAAEEADRARRLAAICGAGFLEQSLAVHDAGMDLRLTGWIGAPEYSRSQADLQYFFLNGRVVRDKLIGHALRQAYQDLLYHGRHPAYVLYLEMDPALVDVNVHPTKHEVRFREARLVHDFIYRSVARALGEGGAGAQSAALRNAGATPGPAFPMGGSRPGAGKVREAMAHYAALTAVPGDATPARSGGAAEPPLGHALAQLHGAYLLSQNDAGLVLVDLPAARRQVVHKRLAAAFAGEGVRSQPLLVPISLSVSAAEAEAVESHRELLTRLGLDLARNGPESVAVHRIPALLRDVDPGALVRAVLGVLAAQGEAEDDVLWAMAAHSGGGAAAVDLEQMNVLLRDLETQEGQASRPQRPPWIQLTREELDSLFRR